jgi:hypothetical protein
MFSRREPQLRTVFKASAAIPKQIRMIQIQMTEKISRFAGRLFDQISPLSGNLIKKLCVLCASSE